MRARSPQAGFSLIELMMVLVIFVIVSGAVFLLLNTAQIRYTAERQQSDALQGARTGLEILTRDISRAGFPALNAYDTTAAITMNGAYPTDKRVAVPFTGMVGGVINQTCIVNTTNPTASTCNLPGPFELVIETDLNPEDGLQQVEWIHYYLGLSTEGNTCTLYRAQSSKTPATNPLTAAGTPLTEQVINRADGTCVLDATQPANSLIFRYVCDNAAATCNPQNISEVYIDLPVRPYRADIQTRQVRALTLHGTARRLNPTQ